MSDYKNLLVAYHGGGYDGCFWEWNWFAFDKDGNFQNLASSGRHGVKTVEEALEKIKGAEVEETTWTYDLTDEKEIESFQRNHSVPHVVGVVDKLNSGEWGEYDTPNCEGVWCRCDVCKKKVLYECDIVLDGWHGCGGIASTADDKICVECHSAGTCEDCNSYVGVDNLRMIGEYMRCEDCEKVAFKKLMVDVGEEVDFLSYVKLTNTFEESDAETVLKDEQEGDIFIVNISNYDKWIVLRHHTEVEAIDSAGVWIKGKGVLGIASCGVHRYTGPGAEVAALEAIGDGGFRSFQGVVLAR